MKSHFKNLTIVALFLSLCVSPWFILGPETFGQKLAAGAITFGWTLWLIVGVLYFRPKRKTVIVKVNDEEALLRMMETREGQEEIIKMIRRDTPPPQDYDRGGFYA